MKMYVLSLLSCASLTVAAQDFQGVAVYESKTVLNLSGKTPEGEEITIDLGPGTQEMMAKAMEKSYTLQFNKTASLYQENEKLEAPTGGGMLSINFAGGGNQYKNLKTKTSIIESDIFDKEFLIVDSLKKHDWQLVNETKKIGSYTCYKATFTIKAPPMPQPTEGEKKVDILSIVEKDRVVTAWYTPEIPLSHGPGEYWGLPGLILEVNDGRTTLLCSKITLNPKEKFEIRAPKKGEKVSQAEFDAIMEKKLNEMDQMNSTTIDGNGNTTTRVIRIGG